MKVKQWFNRPLRKKTSVGKENGEWLQTKEQSVQTLTTLSLAGPRLVRLTFTWSIAIFTSSSTKLFMGVANIGRLQRYQKHSLMIKTHNCDWKELYV